LLLIAVLGIYYETEHFCQKSGTIKLDSRRNMCITLQYVSEKEEREAMGRKEGMISERKKERKKNKIIYSCLQQHELTYKVTYEDYCLLMCDVV
jgi:hypothetical protein